MQHFRPFHLAYLFPLFVMACPILPEECIDDECAELDLGDLLEEAPPMDADDFASDDTGVDDVEDGDIDVEDDVDAGETDLEDMMDDQDISSDENEDGELGIDGYDGGDVSDMMSDGDFNDDDDMVELSPDPLCDELTAPVDCELDDNGNPRAQTEQDVCENQVNPMVASVSCQMLNLRNGSMDSVPIEYALRAALPYALSYGLDDSDHAAGARAYVQELVDVWTARGPQEMYFSDDSAYPVEPTSYVESVEPELGVCFLPDPPSCNTESPTIGDIVCGWQHSMVLAMSCDKLDRIDADPKRQAIETALVTVFRYAWGNAWSDEPDYDYMRWYAQELAADWEDLAP